MIDLDPDPIQVNYDGRLTRRRDKVGHELTFNYKTWTNAEITAFPSRQCQINTVTDEFSNVLTFNYAPTQHLGRWCKTALT